MNRKVTKQIMESFIKDYLDNMSIKDMVSKYQIDHKTIHKYLKKENIPLRRKMSKRLFEKDFNKDFFKTYTTESCWVAGFIATDGCIEKHLRYWTLALSGVDKEALEQILFLMNVPINRIRNFNIKNKSGYISNISILEISSKTQIEDLKNNFNIIPQKTPILKFPKNLTPSMLSHFCRGLIDGDGFVAERGNKSGYTVGFTCNSHIFIKDFLNILIKNINGSLINKKGQIPKLFTHNNNLQFRIGGKPALEILKWLYKDSNENIRLKRKYLRYINALEKYDK